MGRKFRDISALHDELEFLFLLYKYGFSKKEFSTMDLFKCEPLFLALKEMFPCGSNSAFYGEDVMGTVKRQLHALLRRLHENGYLAQPNSGYYLVNEIKMVDVEKKCRALAARLTPYADIIEKSRGGIYRHAEYKSYCKS